MKEMLNIKKSLRLFVTGFIMGSADIVPGVSGGTVAFLMGIYEELIQSIKLVSGKVLGFFIQFKFKEGFQLIPFPFLLPLVTGLFTALFTLSGIISYLIDTYPQYLWAFFFGLVLSSAFVVRTKIITWNIHDYIALILTSIFTYILVGAVPVETPNTYLALFLSGAIAICAMILPGISGSFLLVVMGKYEQVLGAVVNRDFLTLFVFGSGTVIGLALFSRVLSWLFKKHHDIIIAVLIGFMLGSLRKVWPWKEVIATRINSHGKEVPLIESNIFPEQLNIEVFMCILLFAFGFGLVLLLDKVQITQEHVEDIEDPEFKKSHIQSLESQKSGKI